MGVTFTTTDSELNAIIEAEIQRVHQLTLRALSYLGEKCIIEARDRPQEESWIDRTGNLRSSVGYVISHNGNIVKYGGFKKAFSGSLGTYDGKRFAESIVSKHKTGYALIVVAGMNYAEYVEAMDNKVVLASAELFARKELPRMMEKLKAQSIL